jgi:hypothetical protein
MPRLTAIKIDNTRASDQDVLLADGLFVPSRSPIRFARLDRAHQAQRQAARAYAWPLPTIGIKEARAKAAHIVAVERGTARVTVTAERIA